jgi:hypothetical protein
MSDSYHKNKRYLSAGKEMARSSAYASLTHSQLFDKYHIVIASEECGDIKFLLALGVKPDRIIACDLSMSAVCNAKRYGVHTLYCDIAYTVTWSFNECGRHNIGSINVDLCETMKTTLPTLKKIVALKPSMETAIFYTFCRRNDMRGDARRMQFFSQHINAKRLLTIKYQSQTKDNRGSHMCLIRI